MSNIKLEDLHIGDKFITKDNETATIIALHSIPYINYTKEIYKLDNVEKLNAKFTNNCEKNKLIYYTTIIYNIDNTNYLISGDIDVVKKLIIDKKKKGILDFLKGIKS